MESGNLLNRCRVPVALEPMVSHNLALEFGTGALEAERFILQHLSRGRKCGS